MRKMLDFCIKFYKKYDEIWNYLIIGVLTTIVNLIVKWGMLYTFLEPTNGIHVQIAVVTSWVVACIFAYITNRKIVFKSKSKKIITEIISFVTSRLFTLILEMLIMYVFVTLLRMNTDLWIFVWTIVAQIVVIVMNYVLSKLFVFRKQNKNV